MRTFDATAPADDDKEGLGAEELRDSKTDFSDRFSLDHHMGTSILPTNPACDGYHKQVTLKPLGSDPATITGSGRVYTKTIDGEVELFYKNSNSDAIQITNKESLAVRLSYNSAVLYTGATSALSPVIFATVVFDILSEQSVANGKFTALRLGTYIIMVNAANAATITLRLNGSVVTSAVVAAGGQATFVQQILATEYIEIYSSADIGTTSVLNIGRLS
jgi:hypothetical protein